MYVLWKNDKGKLKLFPRNFFNACDGIFLNYKWNQDNLLQSTKNAGDRILDVYVGVDVFGRNCYGGGGFNTDSALSFIRQHGLSVAIFAPGWVYECNPIQEFHQINTKFWLSLLPYLSIHEIAELPIFTNFCPGYGRAEFSNGQVVKIIL